jgi:hypothetical protein
VRDLKHDLNWRRRQFKRTGENLKAVDNRPACASTDAVSASSRRREPSLSSGLPLVFAHFLAEEIRKPPCHANDEDDHEQAEQTVITRKQKIPSHLLPPV